MPSAPVSDLKSKVLDLLNEAGLLRISDALPDFIKDSLILKTNRSEETIVPLGQSRIGGHPDLSTTLEWPVWNDVHLAFIAQINLAELPTAEFLDVLPKSGLLYFFYCADQTTWGYDPADKGSWRVLFGGPAGIRRSEFPDDLPESGRYNCCSVSFSHSISIPSYDAPCIEELQLTGDEHDKFIEFEQKAVKLIGDEGCIHRLLGHPDQIQNDMQTECQLVSHGIYYGNSSGRNDPRASALKAGAKDWELLLQIDTEDDARMMWGDVGRIYYWIPREALQQKNFESAWMTLQCY
jgi:uncharacterized protein YwqG